MISFFVAGMPQPQGSAKAFVVAGRARVTSANPKNAGWREVVKVIAQQHIHEMIVGAVELHINFVMSRPKSLPKKGKPMTTKPDIDKLARSCLDGLTGVAYADDSQVTSLGCTKRYADIGEQSGALISVGARA